MIRFIDKEKLFTSGVVLLHLLWFIVSILAGNMHTGDSAEYEQQAINIRDHGSFYAWYWDQPVDPDYHTWRPLVYGLFIFLCKSIIDNNYFFIFLQNLFSIGTCLLLLHQCLRLPQKINPRWWILAGLALYPSWFMIVNSISADSLFLFIVMLAFSFLQRYLASQRTADFIAYNLLLLLGLFTKPALLYFWIPNLLYCGYLYFSSRKKILLLFPLLFPLMVTFWCARNYAVTGYWHFSSVSHINLVYYNANYPLMHKFGNDYADSVSNRIVEEARTQKTYAERARYTTDKSVAIIRDYPFHYLYWHLKGSMLLFLEPGRSDWIHYFNAPPPDNGSFSIALDEKGLSGVWEYARRFSLPMLLLMAVLAGWNLVLLVLTLKGLWAGRNLVYIRFLILFFLYITVLTGVVGCARYRLTIYPLMLMTATLALPGKFTGTSLKKYF